MQDGCISFTQLKELKDKLLHVSANDNDFFQKLNAPLQETVRCVISTEGNQQKRLLAYDTLTLCLHRLTRYVKKYPDCLTIQISNYYWEQLEGVICDRWDGSDNTHQDLLIELIKKSLNFQDVMYQGSRADNFLSHVSRMNFSLRIVHKIIEIAVNRYGVSLILKHFNDYVTDAIECIDSRSLSATLARSVSSVLRGYLHEIHDIEQWVDLWRNALYKAVSHPSQHHRFNALQYIAPAIFKLSPEGFVEFMQYVSRQKPFHVHAVVGCLTVGKEIGCFVDLDEDTWSSFALRPSFLEDICQHASEAVRTDAVSLLLRHRQIQRAIPMQSLAALKRSMDAITCETSAEQRNLLIGSFLAGIERLRSSTYNINKEIQKRQGQSEELGEVTQLESQLGEYKNFCEFLVHYVTAKFSPTAVYQQYNMSFRILRLLLMTNMDQRTIVNSEGDQVQFPFHVDIWTTRLVQSLVEALLNGYNDIRSWATECLRKCPPDVFMSLIESSTPGRRKNQACTLDIVEDRAYHILLSGRQKEADGGARVIEMVAYMRVRDLSSESPLSKIQRELKHAVARGRFQRSKAIKQTPLHGYLITLKLMVYYFDVPSGLSQNSTSARELIDLTTSLISISQDIWELTKEVLCSDAPEGMQYSDVDLQFESENFTEELPPSAQSILSYSWRAMSQLSEFWGTMFSKVMQNEAAFNWNVQEISIISQMLQTWLMESRHRGALSAVFPHFSALSLLCFTSSKEEIQGLPSKWLDTCLYKLISQSRTITRRSGGLPFLVVAILSTEKDPLAPEFQKVMSRLVACAKVVESKKSFGLELPKVHAINCIKAILSEARLSGSKSADWLDDVINVSIISFSSTVWSVKNAALQLFTTVMNKILGTYRSRNQMINRNSKMWTLQSILDRYPALETVFQREFSLAEQGPAPVSMQLTTENVMFPLLSLLARLDVPTPISGPLPVVTLTIRDFLYTQLSSPIWKMREMAASSIPCLVPSADSTKEMVEFIKIHKVSQNHMHGCLLAVESLYNSTFSTSIPQQVAGLEAVAKSLDDSFDGNWTYNRCPITREIYLRLFLRVKQMLKIASTNFTPRHSLSSFVKQGNLPNMEKMGHHSILLLTSILKYLVDAEVSDIEWMPLMTTLTIQSQTEAIVHFHSFLIDHPLQSGIPADLVHFLVKSTENDYLNGNPLKLSTSQNTRKWPPMQHASFGILYQYFDKCRIPAIQDLGSYAKFLESEMSKSGALSVRESALSLMGPVLRHLLTGGQIECGPLISSWLLQVRARVHDSSPVSSRVTVLHGMVGLIGQFSFNDFIGLLLGRKICQEQLITIFLVIFDLLSDEAEELRCGAAKLLATLLNEEWIMEPIACSWILLDMLCNKLGFSEELQRVMVDRLLVFKYHLSTMFQCTQSTSNVLFEVEKQNLWRDETRVYDQFLSHLSTLTAASTTVLVSNVHNALETSFLWLQQQGYDGPLGFTRDSEVYLNLFRLFRLATQLHSEVLNPQLERIKELSLQIDLHEGLRDCLL